LPKFRLNFAQIQLNSPNLTNFTIKFLLRLKIPAPILHCMGLKFRAD